MSDIQLTEDGDLFFSEGSFKDLALTTEKNEIAQRLRIRLRSFANDWFLDLSDGIPYFEDILKKNPNINIIRGLFKSAILAVEGVTSLLSFEMQNDPSTRTLSIEFGVMTTGGELPIAINIL